MKIKTGQIRRNLMAIYQKTTVNGKQSGWTQNPTPSKLLKAKGLRHKEASIKNVKAGSRKVVRMEHELNFVNVLEKVGFLIYSGTFKASHVGGIFIWRVYE